MKKILLLLMFCFLITSLMSCEVETRFYSKDINDFLDEFSEKYPIIEDTKVRKSPGHIKIGIYFTSQSDIDLDETMYEDIREFFMQVDVQERILKKFDSSSHGDAYYPVLLVDFIDSNVIESHDITSFGEAVNDGPNNYSEWTEPYFYNKGYYTMNEKATDDVVNERAKMYDEIRKTILENSDQNYVSLIYNFGSLKDEHVVLNITFNSNDEEYDKLNEVWHNEYDEVFNLVVSMIDWKYIMKRQEVTFVEDHSIEEKYVFRNEKIGDDLIDSDYFLLEKNLLEENIILRNNGKYILWFTIEGSNKLKSYRIEEIE